MKDLGKRNVLGVLVDAVDYEAATRRIIAAAEEGRSYAVSALAVHGVMSGVLSKEHQARLNQLDLVTPDGQPVRWALNSLYETQLSDRVYGPTLTMYVCEQAARRGLPLYLYGSRAEVVTALRDRLQERFPGLRVAGAEPSAFRALDPRECDELADRVRRSGARLVLVGLGCPRQEVFVHAMRGRLPMPVMAVGAAFDYHAGFAKEPPLWVQDRGLQWLGRLAGNPRRLWRRYLLLSPAFVALWTAQKVRAWRPSPQLATVPGASPLPG